MPPDGVARNILVRRGQLLSRVTLAYNAAEGIAALIAGSVAGSVALVGFGIDSVIEVPSSVTALWRLRSDADPGARERTERIAVRIIGESLVALALYVAADATHALWTRATPLRTIVGIVISALSVTIMPLLARAKRRVAIALGSRALSKDATQTDLCAYLSAIVLGGLLLNAVFGWWWADPVAALAMSPIIAKEGLDALRRKEMCNEC
jgi:divalent metal cation (Fe/Co/Zn/Cd) transporter